MADPHLLACALAVFKVLLLLLQNMGLAGDFLAQSTVKCLEV